MALNPVVTNTASQTCPETISSNCITYAGTLPDGLCGPASVTQVITNLQTQVSSAAACCQGTFPPGNVSAYTGLWVPFTSSIPTSGSWAHGVYTTSNFGAGGMYAPQYRWTQDGDLLVRGTFQIDITSVTAVHNGFIVPLVTLNPINFPTGWTASQNILTTVFSNAVQSNIDVSGYCLLVLDYPSGILSLNTQFIDTPLSNITVGPVNLSARFNNA